MLFSSWLRGVATGLENIRPRQRSKQTRCPKLLSRISCDIRLAGVQEEDRCSAAYSERRESEPAVILRLHAL
jgi:hypothetical protein